MNSSGELGLAFNNCLYSVPIKAPSYALQSHQLGAAFLDCSTSHASDLHLKGTQLRHNRSQRCVSFRRRGLQIFAAIKKEMALVADLTSHNQPSKFQTTFIIVGKQLFSPRSYGRREHRV